MVIKLFNLDLKSFTDLGELSTIYVLIVNLLKLLSKFKNELL